MSNPSAVEQMGLAALTQELEDARNTRASISSDFAPTAPESEYLTQPGTAAGAATADPQLAMATQLGPWDTGYFTFQSGVAVGGYSNLTLYQNGAFNYSGHFHVSGAISYNTSFVWAVRTCTVPATVYTFAHNGRVHGTFEAGSRDDDWGRSEIHPALAAGWSTLAGCWSWHWEARVNADFGVFLDDIIKLVAAGQAIGTVVKIFV